VPDGAEPAHGHAGGWLPLNASSGLPSAGTLDGTRHRRARAAGAAARRRGRWRQPRPARRAIARLGFETTFREDARALRARLHPFGCSRLELGYRDTLDHAPAQRHAQLERAAGGRDAVQLRQLARAERGGASGAAARRPGAQLEREYRTIIGTMVAVLRDAHEGQQDARQQMLVQGPPVAAPAAASVSPHTLRAAGRVLVCGRNGTA